MEIEERGCEYVDTILTTIEDGIEYDYEAYVDDDGNVISTPITIVHRVEYDG